jgi:hypothetical protein
MALFGDVRVCFPGERLATNFFILSSWEFELYFICRARS